MSNIRNCFGSLISTRKSVHNGTLSYIRLAWASGVCSLPGSVAAIGAMGVYFKSVALKIRFDCFPCSNPKVYLCGWKEVDRTWLSWWSSFIGWSRSWMIQSMTHWERSSSALLRWTLINRLPLRGVCRLVNVDRLR